MAPEVAHEGIEDLIDEIIADGVDQGVLEDELGVDDEGEALSQRQQEVDVLMLRFVRRGRRQQLLEDGDLLAEERDVRRLWALERGVVVMEPDAAEAARRALAQDNLIVQRMGRSAMWCRFPTCMSCTQWLVVLVLGIRATAYVSLRKGSRHRGSGAAAWSGCGLRDGEDNPGNAWAVRARDAVVVGPRPSPAGAVGTKPAELAPWVGGTRREDQEER